MASVCCDRTKCKHCVHTLFYGYMCGNSLVHISSIGKCTEYEKKTKEVK